MHESIDKPSDGRNARGLATRRRIMDAAEDAILESGYEGLTTKQVVERSGVAERTIFRHFGTLEEIVLTRSRDYMLALMTTPQMPPDLPLTELPARIRGRIEANLADAQMKAKLNSFLHILGRLDSASEQDMGRHMSIILTSLGAEIASEMETHYPGLNVDQRVSVRMYATNISFAFGYGILRWGLNNADDPIDRPLNDGDCAAIADNVRWAFDTTDQGSPRL